MLDLSRTRRLRVRSSLLAPLLAVALCMPASAAPPLVPDESPAFNDWLRGVQTQIATSAAKAAGFPRSARVVVALKLKPDGSVEDAHALDTSDPDPRFRALAEHVVELAKPFPPMPPSANHPDGVAINVPLFFNLLPPPKRKPAPPRH